MIQKEPDFTTWSEQFVSEVLKNKKIDRIRSRNTEKTEEFDDDWEQNVWRICQISSFLKQRAYQLSKLLKFYQR